MASLIATRARIAQLDTEIEKLRQLMDSLLAEREQCQQVLADYKYPVLTLPAEITSEIFMQFLPSYPHRPSFVEFQSPSFLLQICRRWRDVALATPALWSTMELLLYNSPHHAQQRDLLKMWLQRSGSFALSILFDYYKESADDEPLIQECIEALLDHAWRWQDIDITFSFEELCKITGAMPLLRSVTIGIERGEERPETPVVLFADAPALKHVDLHASFNPFILTLPWSQITSLTAKALYVKEAVEILRHTTILEDCTLNIYPNEPGPPTDFSIPSLPLRSLRLQCVGGGTDEMRQLFRALHLPALQTLLVHEGFLGPDPVATLSAVRPNGYPQNIEILGARNSRQVYQAAFPLASLTVVTPPLQEWD
ncbi:hypothetical protein FB45DRAFT_1058147 [Roridomyces roridus]|uniref:F-box domain-containing protein n=1 Tax=Roridomyces roridus TaxID=1738132 RepID=A0AAD7BXN3_9AGAR|nr:hypothetical protein FB45DRAFT_1058147 [Roridomyces roridus]